MHLLLFYTKGEKKTILQLKFGRNKYLVFVTNFCIELQNSTTTTPVQRFYIFNAFKSQVLETEKLASGFYERVTSAFSHIDRFLFLLTNTFRNITMMWDDIQESASQWLNNYTKNDHGGHDGIIYEGNDFSSENFKGFKLLTLEFIRPFGPNTDITTIYWNSLGLDLPGYLWPGGITYPRHMRETRQKIFKEFQTFLVSVEVTSFCFQFVFLIVSEYVSCSLVYPLLFILCTKFVVSCDSNLNSL